MSSTDADLVRRCLTREPGADRELIERYQADAFGLSFRLLNHRHDAEDVVQETFVRVFRSLHRWDATRPLKPWILGIAFNRCRTWITKKGKRPEPVDYLHETPAKPADEDSAELTREIGRALSALRPEFQSVFVMFHEQGLAYEEIAVAHERPVGTIKTWLHRARTEVLGALRERGMIPLEDVS